MYRPNYTTQKFTRRGNEHDDVYFLFVFEKKSIIMVYVFYLFSN